MKEGEKPFGLVGRDHVQKECLNIVMERTLYPQGEGKPFKTSKPKNNNTGFELLKVILSAKWDWSRERKMEGSGINP